DSEFHENYKNVVPPAKAQDTIMVTGTFGPIRLWRNNYSMHHGLVGSKEEKIAEEKTMDLEAMREANKAYEVVYEGDINEGAVLLGQSIGIINSVDKVSDIVNSAVSDAEKLLKNGASLVK
ncbi:MAG: hypothetical protein ACTSPS_17685, partial [Promethearchaeota archaeon]